VSEPVLGPIVLLTDFGTTDWFVGTMKGVIDQHCPGCKVIDLCHDIAPQNVRQGEFVLNISRPWFRPGTIFVAVVDPGVGTDRDAVIIEDPDAAHLFVGPNNGLFGFLSENSTVSCRRISPRIVPGIAPLSSTFHGRDIFAPAAALLAAGNAVDSLAAEQVPIVRILGGSDKTGDGEIVHFDRFGNALTDIASEVIEDNVGLVRIVGFAAEIAVVRTYSDVQPGEPLAYRGSAGFLEIAIRNGSAHEELGLHLRQRVRLVRSNS
jgi:S-adenosylmethionine hydrolase